MICAAPCVPGKPIAASNRQSSPRLRGHVLEPAAALRQTIADMRLQLERFLAGEAPRIARGLLRQRASVAISSYRQDVGRIPVDLKDEITLRFSAENRRFVS